MPVNWAKLEVNRSNKICYSWYLFAQIGSFSEKNIIQEAPVDFELKSSTLQEYLVITLSGRIVDLT